MILDSLNSLEQQILARIEANRGAAPNTPEGLQAIEDRRRIAAIGALRIQLADPGRSQAIESARTAAEALGRFDATQAYDDTSGQARASAAGRGLLGSSRHRLTQGRARDALSEALTGVTEDTTDQANAIRRADEAQALGTVEGILAPTGSTEASMATILAGNQAQTSARILADQVGSRSRAALSQAIGGFLGNAGGGYVNASFDRAERIDRAKDSAWYDNNRQGPRPSTSAPTSPWSSLFQ